MARSARWFWIVAVVVVWPCWAFGERPAPEDKPAAAAVGAAGEPAALSMPKREVKFDVSESEQEVPLRSPESSLLEQRYVAVFQFVGAGPPETTGLHYAMEMPPGAGSSPGAARYGGMRMPTRAPQSYALPSQIAAFRQVLGSRIRAPQAEYLLKEIPKEHLPPKEIVSLLTGTDSYVECRADVVRREGEDEKYIYRVQILARTAEQAEALAKGVLTLYDYGLFLPLRRQIMATEQEYGKYLGQLREQLQKEQATLADLQKEMEAAKSYSDITKETLGNFTTQLRLISVDMAGVKARIEACDKLLKPYEAAGVKSTRVEQIELLKTTAEIELSGLQARKAAIEEIVQKGQSRLGLSARMASANSRTRDLENRVEDAQRVVAFHQEQLKRYEPFPVENNTVTIRRIKWAPVEAK